MAEAIISRLPRSAGIGAYDRDPARLKMMAKKYKIKSAKDNLDAFLAAPIVILAVKPQNIAEVLAELAHRRQPAARGKLVISIAAGINLKYLQQKLPGCAVIRAMPNNPSLVGMGIAALAKGKTVSRREYAAAARIFSAVGEVVAVPEKWMDAVTGLSGSGPAFVYSVIEAMIAGGVACGLPPAVAARLTLQTIAGAVETVKRTGHAPKKLRDMVSSPGGTTIAGLAVLEEHMLASAFQLAVKAATDRAGVLSKQWAR